MAGLARSCMSLSCCSGLPAGAAGLSEATGTAGPTGAALDRALANRGVRVQHQDPDRVSSGLTRLAGCRRSCPASATATVHSDRPGGADRPGGPTVDQHELAVAARSVRAVQELGVARGPGRCRCG